MKKTIILTATGILLLPAIILIIKFSKTEKPKVNTDFLRIHIRANSNSDVDQNVKFKVKEKIVEYLTPLVLDCESQKESKNIIKNNLNKICEIANTTLKQNGFDYTANADIRTEEFPTRSYETITLPHGNYEALILELGSGSGDNWWCVMFPPLCFVESENSGNNKPVYKSKIWEIIKKYC